MEDDAGCADGRVLKHVSDCHGLTGAAYRREVLSRAWAQWPEPITAQVMRTRLAAYKAALCDAEFEQGVCASCARGKKLRKLTPVLFPSASAEAAPDWLGWKAEQWPDVRQVWFEQVDKVLNVDEYLQTYFKADARVAKAACELQRAENPAAMEAEPPPGGTRIKAPSFETGAEADAWYQRVLRWRANLRRDLRADSVLAPGCSDRYWLLYSPKDAVAAAASSDGFPCHLCRQCLCAFTRRSAKQPLLPQVEMPAFCRAHGFWGGPEPEEIRVLSPVERRVIQLGHCYVSVRRVLVGGDSYVRLGDDAIPQYHSRNVFAVPQETEAVQQVVGLLPENLWKFLVVQYVSENFEALQHEPTLTVVIQRLRNAFGWLGENCWEWMKATKTMQALTTLPHATVLHIWYLTCIGQSPIDWVHFSQTTMRFGGHHEDQNSLVAEVGN